MIGIGCGFDFKLVFGSTRCKYWAVLVWVWLFLLIIFTFIRTLITYSIFLYIYMSTLNRSLNISCIRNGQRLEFHSIYLAKFFVQRIKNSNVLFWTIDTISNFVVIVSRCKRIFINGIHSKMHYPIDKIRLLWYEK